MANIVKDKSFDFALKIVKTYQFLVTEKKEYVLSRQLLRSGTAIGALIRESEHAESKKDFIHKMSIALKEANETEYWILLLEKGNYLNLTTAKKLKELIIELLKLLISIIKSSKKSGTK